MKTWQLVRQTVSIFYKDADGCGDFKREGELAPLSECNADISAHLRQCQLSKECLMEKELTLMRAGYFLPN